MSMSCETHESYAGNTSGKYTNLKHTCKYREDRHLIVLNLFSVSINQILVTEFIVTVKVSIKSEYMQCKKCQHSKIKNLIGKYFQK